MNFFEKLKLKSQLRNCDYELAGTVLKQQYYDENKSTELNRLIDTYLENPCFDNAVKIIGYNEMFVFYFTESCNGGLYVRKSTKPEEAGQEHKLKQELHGGNRAESAEIRTNRPTMEAAAAAETMLHTKPNADAADAAAYEQSSPENIDDMRKEKYQQIENAWEELLKGTKTTISRTRTEKIQANKAVEPDKSYKVVKEEQTVISKAESEERMHAVDSEHRIDSFDAEERFESVEPEEPSSPLSVEPVEEPVVEAAPAIEIDDDTKPFVPEPEFERKSDSYAARKKEPEVFFETMPFRNPYENELPMIAGQEEEKPVRSKEPEIVVDPTPAKLAKLTREEEPLEPVELDQLVPDLTKFPNVIATLKIDIKDMKNQAAEYRRQMEDNPQEAAKLEPWVRTLEDAIDEFTLAAAILSQYK